MEACTFSDLIKVLEPWLNGDYIRKVLVQDRNQLIFVFTDGGQKAYRIDGCSRSQLDDILADVGNRGITVVRSD